MRFWAAAVLDSGTAKERRLYISGPKHYTTQLVKHTLKKVHPEWKRIRLRRIKKPSWHNVPKNNA